jgi:hypothetical protein
MTKPRIDKIIFSAVLLLTGLLFLIITLPLGRVAQMVPIRVLVPTIALLLLQLVIDWYARGNHRALDIRAHKKACDLPDRDLYKSSPVSRSNSATATGNAIKEYPILILLGLLPLFIFLIGFILSAALFIWLYYQFYFKKPFLFSAALSLGAAIFLYVLLVLVLGMDIRSGLVWNLAASAI